ncbi:Stress response protein SCP2 [Paenibacillus algorifonticola]|uniref:Stress response protein SCP2 n=2 Tax=Paenibacillus algorifonticola TaxID=684063 RepID=A0A1I2IHH7_9BACL|nr:Stress response protein SCP2 [Paenibacillus algorifonticola]
MQLLKGQKADVTKGRSLGKLAVRFGWKAGKSELGIDAAAFLLSERGRCERDEDFIFYGNPLAANGAAEHKSSGQQLGTEAGDQEVIELVLGRLPEQIAKAAFTVTIYDGEQLGHAFQDVTGLYVRLVNLDTGEELLRYEYGADLVKETAVVAGELYRHNGEWKFSAIGSGFNGGLAALCLNYGLELEGNAAAGEDGESQAYARAEAAAAATMEAPVQTASLSKIDFRKKLVQYTLEKKQLTNVVARVGIVLDISGSMQTLYKNGTVQEVVERILAVACKFDDNGTLDVWVYDNEYSRLPSVTERDFGQYVDKHILNNDRIHKFGRNNEPPVMEDVIRKYTVEENDPTPVFIIFINDGGVVKSIKHTITHSAVQPIFWQFVGIGNSNFEVLKRLDTMEGRIVDNASFFHLDDIAAVSDEDLYDQLLNEFPMWIKAAKEQRIIRP